MAGKKISQLPSLGGSFAAGDLFEISEDGGGGTYVSKKITGTEMITSIGAGSGTVTSVGVSGGTTGLTVTGSPITTAGTITIGGALVAANGGTGQTSYSTGDLLYASGATTLTKLAVGSNTEVLTLAGGVPTWAAPAGGGASDLDGLTDAEIGGGAGSYYNVFLSNGATAGGATQHGTIGVGTTGNIAIGGDALKTLSDGDYNIGIGYNASPATTTGSHNIAIGKLALYVNNSSDNVAIGSDSGKAGSTYGKSVYIGSSAGAGDTVGQNTYIGFQAGNASTGGWQNIALGYQADVSAGAVHRTIAIGTQQTTTQSDTLSLGGLSKTLLHGEYGTTGQAKLGINLGTAWTIPTATLHVKGGGATSGTTALLVEDSTGADIIKVTDDGATEFTGQTFNTLATATDGATVTPDFSAGNVQKLTLAGNRAMANPLNIKAGATYIIVIVQDGTGSRTISSWGSNYKFSGGTAPTLTTTADKADVITMVAYSASILMCTSTLDFATS